MDVDCGMEIRDHPTSVEKRVSGASRSRGKTCDRPDERGLGQITYIGAMLNIVVALPAEAGPLLDRWSMNPVASSSFYPLYEAGDRRLIVSGTGRDAAALATAFLAGIGGAGRADGWLNVGIAGSAGHALGTPILASKVVDTTANKTYYPGITFRSPCATAVVRTVDHVERRYSGQDAYEMEAGGFCLAASRFASFEQVQVLKIISDGPDAPPEQLSKNRVRDLVAEVLPAVEEVINELGQVAEMLERQRSDPPHLDGFHSRWHFTASQRQLLRRLLRSLEAFGDVRQPTDEHLAPVESSRQVLAVLESEVRRTSLRLG